MQTRQKRQAESNDVLVNLNRKKRKIVRTTNKVDRDISDSDLIETMTNVETSSTDIVQTVDSTTSSSGISEKFLLLEQDLCDKLRNINFRKEVEYIYNPLEYAFEVHAMYVRKYCDSTKKILFLGMNPGPWGMSQTGVPFGEINMVRDWLKLSGPVGKPPREQRDRKVTGFDCKRSEISGKRLWGLFSELCDYPENFFRHAYLHNYCPLALMDLRGRNITPAELKGEEQKTLHRLCDETLVEIIKLLEVEIVVSIGRYAETRVQTIVKEANLPVKVLYLPHPSPRAVGNQDWNEKATQKLREYKLIQYFNK